MKAIASESYIKLALWRHKSVVKALIDYHDWVTEIQPGHEPGVAEFLKFVDNNIDSIIDNEQAFIGIVINIDIRYASSWYNDWLDPKPSWKDLTNEEQDLLLHEVEFYEGFLSCTGPNMQIPGLVHLAICCDDSCASIVFAHKPPMNAQMYAVEGNYKLLPLIKNPKKQVIKRAIQLSTRDGTLATFIPTITDKNTKDYIRKHFPKKVTKHLTDDSTENLERELIDRGMFSILKAIQNRK